MRKSWSKLWNIDVPCKVRVFVWRLAKVSLPTADVRASRKMADSDVCSVCNSAPDSWHHSLLECSLAKGVWALTDEDIVDYIAASKQPDPKLWLFDLIDNLPQAAVVKVLVTLWAIWWAKRKAVHEKEYQSPLSTFLFIERFLDDVQIAGEPGRRSCTRQPLHATHTVSHRWIAPQTGFAKTNVDGGLSRAGDRGAASAVCRDENGYFLGASAIVIEGLTDPASLEALACGEALSLAFDLNLSKVQVATDCLQVLRNIREDNPCAYASIVKEFIIKQRMFASALLSHKSRNSNGEAHNLVKAASSLGAGRHVWLMSPPSISCIPQNFL